jgi:hypothetical protein
MSFPGKYRGLVVVGAFALLLGTADTGSADPQAEVADATAPTQTGASELTGESSGPQNTVSVLSEPAMMAVFGIGLLALAGRLRAKLRRIR